MFHSRGAGRTGDASGLLASGRDLRDVSRDRVRLRDGGALKNADERGLHLQPRPSAKILGIVVASGSAPRRKRRENLRFLRKAAGGLLTENEFAVSDNLKHAAGAFEQLGFDGELLSDCFRQTGGFRQVVSLRAVRDRHFHHRLHSRVCRIRCPDSAATYVVATRRHTNPSY